MVTHIGTPLTFATTAGTAASTYDMGFEEGVPAGTLLILSIARSYSSSGHIPLTSLTDDAGNTWHLVAEGNTGSSSTVAGYVAVCFVENAISQGDEIHVEFAGTQGRCAAVVEAFGNAVPLDPENPIGQIDDNFVTSAQGSYDGGTTATESNVPFLAITALAGGGRTNELTSVTGFNLGTRFGTTSPTSAYRFTQMAWREGSTAEAVSATGTFSANTTYWGCVFTIPLDGSEPEPPSGGAAFAEWNGSELVPLTPMEWDGEKLIPLMVAFGETL